MEPLKIAKQVVGFNKTAFENTFNALVTLQENAEKMADSMMSQAAWMPDDGKKVINDWVANFKSGRAHFKQGVDDAFGKVDGYFDSFDKTEK